MNSTNNTIKKGDTVWYTNGFRNSGLNEGIVTSAGRKYITVNERYKFHTSNFREVVNYGAPGALYTSEKEYYDEVELRQNLFKIRNEIDFHNSLKLTVEQTREILEIMYRNSKEK